MQSALRAKIDRMRTMAKSFPVCRPARRRQGRRPDSVSARYVEGSGKALLRVSRAKAVQAAPLGVFPSNRGFENENRVLSGYGVAGTDILLWIRLTLPRL